jgi:nucleotide-binding universal stress UspA family protein
MSESRILFCVNDAFESRRAAQEVALRRWPKGAEVRFLTVINPDDYSLVALLDERISEIRRLHNHLFDELSETPVICTSSLREGEPLASILEEVRDWQPTRIFVGVGRRNRLSRLFRPRLAAAVEARVDCSVEVIGHEDSVRESLNRLATSTARILK